MPKSRCSPARAAHQRRLAADEQNGAAIDAVPSDNGRKFRRREDQQLDGLFPQIKDLQRKRTRVRRRHPNGIIGRLHRTLFDDHLGVEGHYTRFAPIEEIQAQRDACPAGYNGNGFHRDHDMNGRTPGKALRNGIRKATKNQDMTALKTAVCPAPSGGRLSGARHLCTAGPEIVMGPKGRHRPDAIPGTCARTVDLKDWRAKCRGEPRRIQVIQSGL